VTRVTDLTTKLMDDAEHYAQNVQYLNAFISLVGAVRELKREHSSVAHMAAITDPGLLERVSKLEAAESVGVSGGQFIEQRITELERLTGMLVKSVGALAATPQPRAAGQPPRDTGAWPFIASLDRGDRPATYGPVPSPYGRPSPAYAVDQVTVMLLYALSTDGVAHVEYAAVEYVNGEPTLQVQVSGVLYRFHAPDVLPNKGNT
jgi:hypothetical protein